MTNATPSLIATKYDLTISQGIFDHVYTEIVKQGRGSLDPEAGCAYRAPGGLKCAVGVLIPDAYYTYKAEVDGGVESASWKDHAALASIDRRVPRTTSVRNLLADMQEAHDNAAVAARDHGAPFVSNFAAYMARTAKNRRLSPAVLAGAA